MIVRRMIGMVLDTMLRLPGSEHFILVALLTLRNLIHRQSSKWACNESLPLSHRWTHVPLKHIDDACVEHLNVHHI